ncbi:MAG: DUF4198 domain-containing protein [Defluviitaleaceae bacterium]|nr:DUF4198 domain-containing protein [Defluviitaleaceae bacterium]MCL2262917.1 DUF4198 domain-containing protein [Defluviitaleaceae bacterium]
MFKVSKRKIAMLICAVMLLAFPANVFAHGVFLDVSDMHGAVGQEVTVQVGWGYVFMGHDGSAITGAAAVRRMFLLDPSGTEIALTYSVFHQYQGRDYPDNPINEIDIAQLGSDEFPAGGRNITYIQATFTAQVEGYYQIVFHRDRNVPDSGPNEGRQITDVVKAFILVGDAQPTPEAGHGTLTDINSVEIRPVSDVGRLTPSAEFEGYVLFGGEPAADQEVRLEIAAHDYVIVATNAQGRFSVTLPAEAGEYAIRVTRDCDQAGELHGQDFTSSRAIHILQIATRDGVGVELPDIAELPAANVPVAARGVLRLAIGSTAYTFGGQTGQLDAAPVITGGRTMVPLRVISEMLGAEVRWDAAAQAVYIYIAGN